MIETALELKQQLTSALSREKALREALEDLRDVQNGPPLIRWEKEWNEAMEKTRQALYGKEPTEQKEIICLKCGGLHSTESNCQGPHKPPKPKWQEFA